MMKSYFKYAFLALPIMFSLIGASCPEKKPGERGQASYPLWMVNEKLQGFAAGTKVVMTRKQGRVSMFGVEEVFYYKDMNDPIFGIEEYPNDIHQETVTAFIDPVGLSLSVVIKFEETGKEILGTWHGDMYNMVLGLSFLLIVENNRITISKQSRSYFSVKDIDLSGIPDAYFRIFYDYLEDIKTRVRLNVDKALFREEVRERITSELTSRVIDLLGFTGVRDADITGLTIRDGNMIVDYVAK